MSDPYGSGGALGFGGTGLGYGGGGAGFGGGGAGFGGLDKHAGSGLGGPDWKGTLPPIGFEADKHGLGGLSGSAWGIAGTPGVHGGTGPWAPGSGVPGDPLSQLHSPGLGPGAAHAGYDPGAGQAGRAGHPLGAQAGIPGHAFAGVPVLPGSQPGLIGPPDKPAFLGPLDKPGPDPGPIALAGPSKPDAEQRAPDHVRSAGPTYVQPPPSHRLFDQGDGPEKQGQRPHGGAPASTGQPTRGPVTDVVTQRNPDGSAVTRFPGGATVTTLPDGRSVTIGVGHMTTGAVPDSRVVYSGPADGVAAAMRGHGSHGQAQTPQPQPGGAHPGGRSWHTIDLNIVLTRDTRKTAADDAETAQARRQMVARDVATAQEIWAQAHVRIGNVTVTEVSRDQTDQIFRKDGRLDVGPLRSPLTAEERALIRQDAVRGPFNVYYVPRLSEQGILRGGYEFPRGGRGGDPVVIINEFDRGPRTLAHEIGHAFFPPRYHYNVHGNLMHRAAQHGRDDLNQQQREHVRSFLERHPGYGRLRQRP